VKPCERAWCIDRVQGHRLQGHARRTMTASSGQHCLELCLGERDFLCRWVPMRSISLLRRTVRLLVFHRPAFLSAPSRIRCPWSRRTNSPRRNIRRESVRRGNAGSSSYRRAYAPMHFPVIGFLDQLEDVTLRSYTLTSVSQTRTVRPDVKWRRIHKLERVNLTRTKIALFIAVYCRKDVFETNFLD